MSNVTKFVSFASVISEIQIPQSDVFMTVKARILETPKANLNGARVTPAFVDAFIANKERYIGLPLYVDVKALSSGRYSRLGHLYDERTGEFHSTQIGSFYEFEKEDFEGGSYLIGYARIPKRNKAISKPIAELFAEGNLKFSFEIACGDYKKLDDGTIEIDASDNNYLEGTAIVAFPACEDAVALDLVAQRNTGEDDATGGEKEMEKDMATQEIVAETTEEEITTETPTEEVIASEEATAEVSDENLNDQPAEEVTAEAEVEAETETAADDSAEKKECAETAAVLVREEHEEKHTMEAFDTDTGESIRQTVKVETESCSREDGQIVQTDAGVRIAEGETTEEPAEEETPAETVQPAAEDEKQAIAELKELVQSLVAEVQALKDASKEKVVASHMTAEVNPFIGSISSNGTKYDLLEPEHKIERYTLI